MKTKPLLLLNSALLLLLYGMIWAASNYPEQLEAFYSNGIYPFLFEARSLYFNRFPFPLGDITYTVVFLSIIYWIITTNWKNWFLILLRLVTGILLLILWFQLSWGLNYYRKPIFDQKELKSYTEDDLTQLTRFFAQESNRLHLQLSKGDSLPVELDGSKKEIIKRVATAPSQHKIVGKAKISLYSLPLSYMGFSGYLNPFTLEAQVNGRMPKINLPLTTAHEVAHQQGYAAENEANFVGFLHCYQHPALEIQYAAALFGFRYTYNELYKANPTIAREILCSLYPGILDNFKASSAFWQKHKNPLEPLFKKSYDNYLKINNQKLGIQSYNAVVSLLITHFKVERNQPQSKK